MGVDTETASVTYYVSLLMYAGCTVDAEERSKIFGGSLTQHHTHRQHCTRRCGCSRAGSAGDDPPTCGRPRPTPAWTLGRERRDMAPRGPRPAHDMVAAKAGRAEYLGYG
jgi:hypothetical protein